MDHMRHTPHEQEIIAELLRWLAIARWGRIHRKSRYFPVRWVARALYRYAPRRVVGRAMRLVRRRDEAVRARLATGDFSMTEMLQYWNGSVERLGTLTKLATHGPVNLKALERLIRGALPPVPEGMPEMVTRVTRYESMGA